MEKIQDEIEQLRAQFGMLTQEVSSYKHLIEGLLKKQTVIPVQPYLAKMLVKSNGRLIVVQSDNIDWIEAWGDYVRLHCIGKSYIVHQKIGDIQTKLNPQRYIRINRSAILNVDRIKEMEPINHGDYLITLQDNTRLNLSRNYRIFLSAMFNHYL
jgi:DNA-binding LytR/AlgR family response regulator